MIFRPRKPIRFLGIEIVGLIPKRRRELARKIGETVEKELISHRDIETIMKTPEFHKHISVIIRQRVDEFFQKVFGDNVFADLVLSGDIAVSIKRALTVEIEKTIPQSMDSLFDTIQSKFNFKDIVQQRIEGFDLNKLESIINTIASRELKSIELYGAVLGFTVGIIQVILILVSDLYV
jgi:uncharacterized membrane protein YheB (UPF0754 family)